jgi:cellulose synthase/poly-beta-1,6-N-acetylglucosamine synthase-like glycosyltransferase
VFDVVAEQNSALRAKTRPLTQGLDHARGEIILMPDADNRMPPEWASHMTSYFADGVGMVCGPIYPDPHRANRIPLTWFETIDVAFLLGTCAGFSGLGKTQALIGSNFAVRREAYEGIGTYRNLDFHIIEDLSLLRAIQRTKKWKAIFPGDSGTILWTLPQATFSSLIQQRHRWLAGWRYVKPGIRAALAFGMTVHLTWPLWLLMSPAWFLTLYALLVVGDGVVAAKSLWQHSRGRLIWLLPLYPIYAAIYAYVLLFMIISRRKVRWKERVFIN